MNSAVCIVETNNRWYRAKVIGINKNIYNVSWIDYGNAMDVEVEQIRYISKNLTMPCITSICNIFPNKL